MFEFEFVFEFVRAWYNIMRDACVERVSQCQCAVGYVLVSLRAMCVRCVRVAVHNANDYNLYYCIQ